MISIALITYNGKKYIKEQLDSILAQSIHDFELIICDDCSTDSTLSILQEYAQKDKRIKIYRNEKNLGFLRNIEKTIKLCNREFIALADQDDVWEKEHLQILHSNIGENFLVCGDSLLVDEKNNSLDLRFSKMFHKMDAGTLKNDEHFLRLLVMENIFQGAAMMFCKKFSDIALPFPDEIKYHDLWLALCAMALEKFVYIPEIVTRHRSHSGNASGKYTERIRYAKDADFMDKSKLIPLLENLPNLKENSKKIIKQSKKISLFFWFKNYRILHATDSKSRFLIRFLKALRHGQ
jgi:glycosyltransferase involved in cell wall biosynthesis